MSLIDYHLVCTWTDITITITIWRTVHGRTLQVRGKYRGQILQVRGKSKPKLTNTENFQLWFLSTSDKNPQILVTFDQNWQK